MRIIDRPITLPPWGQDDGLLAHFESRTQNSLESDEIAVRFVVTRSDEAGFQCDVATLAGVTGLSMRAGSIFHFRRRTYENTSQFNVALVIPTGIGCEIGGHAGDATPVARLLASVCDNVVIHPNVVNASDINELTENCLYVEGSILTRLLMGTVGLQKVRANRVLFVVEEHDKRVITDGAVNALSAARATLGLNCPEVVRWKSDWTSTIEFTNSGRASGRIENLESLVEALVARRYQYDSVAIASLIKTPPNLRNLAYNYYFNGLINPWGGVEAMLTHALSMMLDVPTAHSPMFEAAEMLEVGIIDPRKAAEAVSLTYLYSILKGLHRSPRLVTDVTAMQGKGIISAEDISCLVIPDGCLGLPTLAALDQGITVIAVRENRNGMKNNLEALPFRSGQLIKVDHYLEAAGVLAAIKAGIEPAAVRRPFPNTRVNKSGPVSAVRRNALFENLVPSRRNGRADQK